MRWYNISVFLMIVNVSFLIVNGLGILNAGSDVPINGMSSSDYANSMTNNLTVNINTVSNSQVANPVSVLSSTFSAFNAVFYFTFVVLPYIATSLLQIAFPQLILNNLLEPIMGGSAWIIAFPLGSVMMIIQAYGIAQYFIGRSFREFQ